MQELAVVFMLNSAGNLAAELERFAEGAFSRQIKQEHGFDDRAGVYGSGILATRARVAGAALKDFLIAATIYGAGDQKMYAEAVRQSIAPAAESSNDAHPFQGEER